MLDNDLITFQTVIKIIQDVKENHKKTLITKIEHSQRFSHLTKMIYKIIRQSLHALNLELKYMPKMYEKYLFGNIEKQFCYDFLIYCLMHADDLFFDLRYFANEDRKEILKFIRNKIYGALMDSAEKHELFDNIDLKYQEEYMIMEKKIQRKNKIYMLQLNEKTYVLPIKHFEPVVFYHKYGIFELPNKVKESIIGKDIIDVGAFIGDTALILNELNPKKIYAFEPVKENIQFLEKTIKLNSLKNVTIIGKALGSNESASYIVPSGSASFINDLGFYKVNIIRLDDFVEKNSLQVGLVKMDVEGFELEVIKGGIKTIQKQTPTLIISLYHTGKDFFEIPKILKTLVPEYKFRFLNLNRASATFERVLIAYV